MTYYKVLNTLKKGEHEFELVQDRKTKEELVRQKQYDSKGRVSSGSPKVKIQDLFDFYQAALELLEKTKD